MKKYSFLFVIAASGTLYAKSNLRIEEIKPLMQKEIESIQDIPSASINSNTLLQSENSSIGAGGIIKPPMVKPTAKPVGGPVQAFYRFVKTLLMILTNPQIQNSLKGIEQLFASLLQTISQVINNNRPIAKLSIITKNNLEFSVDPELVQEIAENISIHLKKTVIRNAAPKNGELDEDTRKIIGSVGGIVEGFCRIVENPNDKNEVPKNIEKMFVNMGRIFSTAITRYGAPIDGSLEEYETFVEGLDIQLKREIQNAFIEAQDAHTN